MQETGVVLRRVGSLADIQIEGRAECNKCSLCQPDRRGSMVARVSNPLGAGPGDTVRIEISSGKFVAAAGLIFMLPLIALIIGLGFGDVLAQMYGLEKSTTHLISVSLGLTLFGLSYLGIHLFDKRVSRQGNWRPRIVEIIEHAE